MLNRIAMLCVLLAGSAALAQAPGMLERADTDQDGMITRDEFTAARAQLFARLDRNADGYLDATDRQKRAERSERLAAARTHLDSNSDGKISKEEFVNGPAPLFNKMDTDHSGVLDAQELAAAKAAAQQRRGARTGQ